LAAVFRQRKVCHRTKLSYLIFDTPLGWVGILGSQRGLVKLVLPQPSSEEAFCLFNEVAVRWQRLPRRARNDDFGDLPNRVRDYLSGEAASFPDKLDLSRASPFQRSVWQMTQSIPCGETRTYGWVAAKVGMPQAARAVGQALARNPLPVVIPCHRVICGDGNLGGFGGGKGWKQRLLEIEGMVI